MANVGEPTYLTDLTNRSGTVAVRCTQATAQTGWTSGTYNTLTFTAEDFNWGTLHDTGTSTSRINIGLKLGLWQVSGIFVANNNASATHQRTRMLLNGTAINGSFAAIGTNSGNFVGVTTTALVLSTVSTDYVEIQGWQTSASGTIGSAVSGDTRSAFQAIFMGTQ